MQRFRWETSFVSSLIACNTKTRWPSLTPDDRSVHHSATPSASRRLSRHWSRILSDHRPLITNHPPGWLSQWIICFLGPRVPLRTVHVAILCWRHRLPMTDWITMFKLTSFVPLLHDKSILCSWIESHVKVDEFWLEKVAEFSHNNISHTNTLSFHLVGMKLDPFP